MPKVSVAIVSWNTKDLVLDCLRSLYERTKDIDFEVFLVDNRSSDGTLEAVQTAFPQVDAIDSGGNLGFAKANNIALRKSTGKYFLLLNPDTVLTDNSVKELADFMDKTPNIGAAGPVILNGDGTLQQSWAKLPTLIGEIRGVLDREITPGTAPDTVEDLRKIEPFETGWVGGACMMVSAEAVKKIGEMDENIFMYSEETDWCKRLHDGGYSVWLDTKATVIHYGGRSSEQASDFSRRQLIRSKSIYFAKHKGLLQSLLLKAALTMKMKIGKMLK